MKRMRITVRNGSAEIHIPDGTYEIEVFDEEQRSTDQNSKLWDLVNCICMKEDGDLRHKHETYLNLLKMANIHTDRLIARKEAVDELRKRDHLYVHIISEKIVRHEIWQTIEIYFGSSLMNKREMSQLIDCAERYLSDIR